MRVKLGNLARKIWQEGWYAPIYGLVRSDLWVGRSARPKTPQLAVLIGSKLEEERADFGVGALDLEAGAFGKLGDPVRFFALSFEHRVVSFHKWAGSFHFRDRTLDLWVGSFDLWAGSFHK